MTTPVATQVLTRVKLSADYRINVAYGGPLAGAYAHARGASAVGVVLDRGVDIQAECTRVGAMFRVQRRFVPVTMPWGDYQLGDVWTVRYPRYGFADGVPGMIVAITPDFIARTHKLTFWM